MLILSADYYICLTQITLRSALAKAYSILESTLRARISRFQASGSNIIPKQRNGSSTIDYQFISSWFSTNKAMSERDG